MKTVYNLYENSLTYFTSVIEITCT